MRSHVWAQLYSFQIPKSFSRIAIWPGARIAQSLASEATVTVPVDVDAVPSIVAAIRTYPPVVRQAWRNLGVAGEVVKALISPARGNLLISAAISPLSAWVMS